MVRRILCYSGIVTFFCVNLGTKFRIRFGIKKEEVGYKIEKLITCLEVQDKALLAPFK